MGFVALCGQRRRNGPIFLDLFYRLYCVVGWLFVISFESQLFSDFLPSAVASAYLYCWS